MTLVFIFHYLLGFIVSFLGSLPLGAINAATIKITLLKGRHSAMQFILGATLAEFIYSFIAVHFSGFLLSLTNLEFYLRIFSIPVFTLVGIIYLRSKPSAEEEVAIRENTFLQGLSIGLLNPLQVPFWLSYGTYLISIGWLSDETFMLNIFVAGIISGSFTLLVGLTMLTHKHKHRFNLNERNVNRFTAFIFFFLAFYQLLHFLQPFFLS
jgi:threonine/homoserine/homoserine lactone efflux protein